MRLPSARTALVVLLGATVLSCSDALTAVKKPFPTDRGSRELTASAVAKPTLVISQVYGGGGNSSAPYANDFIELHNPGGAPVNVSGWSVQYTSANGPTSGQAWAVTPLTGSIPPGGYYLIQEAAGAKDTTHLPTPDATGTPGIAMSATDGKVALVSSTTALRDICPTAVVDLVTYGAVNTSTSITCKSPDAAPKLSNSSAAIRDSAGCAYSAVPKADFSTGAPTPHNSASRVQVCAGAVPIGSFDHVFLVSPKTTVFVGATLQIVATAEDKNNQQITPADLTWNSSNTNVATVSNSGLVSGVSQGTATLTAEMTTTTSDGATATKSASIDVTVTLPIIGWVDFSPSSASFPAGFQTQLFPTARTGPGGEVIDANFTFESADVGIASASTVANTLLVTGVAGSTSKPGIIVHATPKVGGPTYTPTSALHPVTIEVPSFAPKSTYAVNDEFGDPTPAAASNPNDLLIVRDQYTLSYNESRGTPNWVSYELDGRQFGPEDRCNCFSADPHLPADKQILTSDYTNGGYDRGHMTRSADRTVANGDNAATYYLTNVVPQLAALNQGVWADFENALGDSAKIGGRAVYIVTGPLYVRGKALQFIKNEGKVAIPDATWKVALIGPRTAGNPFTHDALKNLGDLAGLTILAVQMPNDGTPLVRDWTRYLTTVDKIEEETGYDFLSLLPTTLQSVLESNDHAPVASFAVASAANEGTPTTFDASSTTDSDLGRTDVAEALTYAWQFSDGTTATGKTITHAFSRYGTYTATLTVTDAFGWPSTTTQSITVNDVAPTVTALPNASLIAGEKYSASGAFADPGDNTWTATVNYGSPDVSGPLVLAGRTFSLAHGYPNAGSFPVTVTVTDDAGKSGMASWFVNVETPLQATGDLTKMVQSLATQQSRMLIASTEAGAPQLVQPLLASLDAASKHIQAGRNGPATNELDAFINKVNAAAMTGRLELTTARQMTSLAARIQRALTLD